MNGDEGGATCYCWSFLKVLLIHLKTSAQTNTMLQIRNAMDVTRMRKWKTQLPASVADVDVIAKCTTNAATNKHNSPNEYNFANSKLKE